MPRSLMGPVIAFGGLAGCTPNMIDGPSATDRTLWELLALLIVSVILLVAFTGLLALLSHRTPPPTEDQRFWIDLASRRVRSHRADTHRHRGRVRHRGRGPARGIDPGASSADSVPHRPTP